MTKQKGKTRFAILCVLPATLMFIIFMVIPTIEVFYLSLFKVSKYAQDDKTFVGLDNFVALFKTSSFIAAFQNTVFLIVIIAIVTFALALIYASVLSREKIKGQNFFRIIFYIPNILSIVVIANIFAMAYRAPEGLINGILRILSGTDSDTWSANQSYIDFMGGNGRILIWAIAFALIWQAIGYYMVMYMSSISAIPESIYESASIEGASRLRVFFEITIPLVWNNIRTTLTFFIISTINLSYTFIRAFIGSTVKDNANVLLFYMTNNAGSYGSQMAVGVVVFLFSFLMSGIVSAVTKREVLEF